MNNLELILNDLKQHHRDRQALLYYYVNNRLTESLKAYYSELNDSITFLDNKDAVKVAKSINKYE